MMIILIVGLFFALCLIYYMVQKRKIRKDHTAMRNADRFDRLMDLIRGDSDSIQKNDNEIDK
jgi:hypothetical protein